MRNDSSNWFNPVNPQPIKERDPVELTGVVQSLVESYNDLVVEELAELCQLTTERMRATSRTDADSAEIVGLPLKRIDSLFIPSAEIAESWTVGEYCLELNKMLAGDTRMVSRDLNNALTRKENYLFADVFVDNFVLPIKSFADHRSFRSPEKGLTHYDLDSLIDSFKAKARDPQVTILMDRSIGKMLIDNPESFPDFEPFPSLVSVTTNCKIGSYQGANLHVKPWIDKVVGLNMTNKPLGWRVRQDEYLGNLCLINENPGNPLNKTIARRMFGFGVIDVEAGIVIG